MLLQRVEKVFSTRCKLLRKFLNFVFLRRKMYINTSTEQKTKNAKNAVSSILTAFLKPHRQHFVLPPPLLKKWRHNSVDYIWRVSGTLLIYQELICKLPVVLAEFVFHFFVINCVVLAVNPAVTVEVVSLQHNRSEIVASVL